MLDQQESIGEIVRKMERDYTTGTTKISEYVEFNQWENINKIEAYINSRHISGSTDSKGRDKPFFNIVTAARNIWYRATDIDRKNIQIKAAKLAQRMAAYLATMHLQEWMKKVGFGTFLNDWGRSLATYGSTVLKFVEKNGELIPSVLPWSRVLCDTIDFDNNVKIEVLWFTPAQLRKNKDYDQDMIEQLLNAREAREDMKGQNRDNKADYIQVYEVHGELPLALLTGKESDEDEYRQQMHVISFLAKKQSKNEWDDYTLYKGRESKDPYMITHLIKEDGRTQSIGAVESLFEAQWMENHTMKNMKDQLDLASQLIFQTADGSFVGRNMISNIMTGDILVHQPNMPLTQVSNNSHDIASLQAFGNQWKVLAQELTSTPDSLMGNAAPSGTAWRQVEALQQEAHSLFELMTENKGLAIEAMMRKYVIPHVKKKMDTTDEIVATLDADGITEFDALYVPNEAIRRENNRKIDTILDTEQDEQGMFPLAEDQDMQMVQQGIKEELSAQGNQRYIKPSDISSKKWKEVLGDLEWQVDVEVTGENKDKQAVLTTLTTVLQTVAKNPAVLQDPNMKMIFTAILEETGAFSSVKLQQAQSQPPVPVVQPQLTQ